MPNTNWISRIVDKGGRRLRLDRRKAPVPERKPDERRTREERRGGRDRRSLEGQGNIGYLRRSMDRYLEFVNAHKGLAYGLLFSLPFWALIILYIMGKLSF